MKWKVYFEESFGVHTGRDHAGKEISVGKQFCWADRDWVLPAVYVCGKGLVLEILERETPSEFGYRPKLLLNGKELSASFGCGVSYEPCPPEQEAADAAEAKAIIEHYGLDTSCGWNCMRWSFPWKTKRTPQIHSLSLLMSPLPVMSPGPHFRVSAPGERIPFVYPASGEEYTLVVEQLEQQEIGKDAFAEINGSGLEYPAHYMEMTYSVVPEFPEKALTIFDCGESDSPRQTECRQDGAAAISIIGGADGPTAVFLAGNIKGKEENEKQKAAFSALHFEPVKEVEWRMVFQETSYEPLEIEIGENIASADKKK